MIYHKVKQDKLIFKYSGGALCTIGTNTCAIEHHGKKYIFAVLSGTTKRAHFAAPMRIVFGLMAVLQLQDCAIYQTNPSCFSWMQKGSSPVAEHPFLYDRDGSKTAAYLMVSRSPQKNLQWPLHVVRRCGFT